MYEETYTDGYESINLSEILNDSIGYEDVHKSHLYPYSENSLVHSTPSLGDLPYEESYHKNLKTIIDAILAGASIADSINSAVVNPFNIIYPGEDDRDLDENSKRLIGTLKSSAELAERYWCVLSLWVNNTLAQLNDKHLDDKLLDFNLKGWWESHASAYFTDHYSSSVMEDVGFEAVDWDVDWEHARVRGKRQIVGPEHAYVTQWKATEALEDWEPTDDDATRALEWFQSHEKELNLLYRTSVHLINYTAYLEYEIWQYIGDEEQESLSKEEYLWTMQPRHKTPRHSFFSHKFRYEHLGENYTLPDLDMPEGEGYSAKSFRLSDIANFVIQAELQNSRIGPYLQFLEPLSKDKDNPHHEWWKVRTEWYEAVEKVKEWYRAQSLRPTDESIKEALWTVARKSELAKKGSSELEKIKLEQLLRVWQDSKKNPQDPFDLKDTLKKYEKFSNEFGPILKTFGYKLELTRVDEDIIHRQEPDTLLWMGGNPQFKDMDLEDDLLKKWRNHNVHKLDNPIFQRSAELDFLLGMHENDPVFREWLRFLSDEDGRCSRHDIGYQKVRSDSKKKPSESTYRNAGMRFAEKHKLDPVKHFTELTLKNVLVSEFEGHCKTNPAYNKDLVVKLRSYINRQRDNESVIMAFLEACQKMHIDSKTVRVLFDRALPRVGFKKANSKTLYNAKHAALAFFLEENLAPKPPL